MVHVHATDMGISEQIARRDTPGFDEYSFPKLGIDEKSRASKRSFHWTPPKVLLRPGLTDRCDDSNEKPELTPVLPCPYFRTKT